MRIFHVRFHVLVQIHVCAHLAELWLTRHYEVLYVTFVIHVRHADHRAIS